MNGLGAGDLEPSTSFGKCLVRHARKVTAEREPWCSIFPGLIRWWAGVASPDRRWCGNDPIPLFLFQPHEADDLDARSGAGWEYRQQKCTFGLGGRGTNTLYGFVRAASYLGGRAPCSSALVAQHGRRGPLLGSEKPSVDGVRDAELAMGEAVRVLHRRSSSDVDADHSRQSIIGRYLVDKKAERRVLVVRFA